MVVFHEEVRLMREVVLASATRRFVPVSSFLPPAVCGTVKVCRAFTPSLEDAA